MLGIQIPNMRSLNTACVQKKVKLSKGDPLNAFIAVIAIVKPARKLQFRNKKHLGPPLH